MKAAIRSADPTAKAPLLRAIITMSYAHWEGYVRTCASRYFQHLALRRQAFVEFERQIYVNSLLARLDALHRGRVSLKERCQLVNDIIDGGTGRFSFVHPDLVDTGANLNAAVIADICLICGVSSQHFDDNRTFLDVLLLKRRNAIAHGQQEFIKPSEVDEMVATTLALMGSFRDLIENKVYTKAYAAQPSPSS